MDIALRRVLTFRTPKTCMNRKVNVSSADQVFRERKFAAMTWRCVSTGKTRGPG